MGKPRQMFEDTKKMQICKQKEQFYEKNNRFYLFCTFFSSPGEFTYDSENKKRLFKKDPLILF